MTAPIDEWDLDALPTRGRSSSVFEEAPLTRGRGNAISQGTVAADQAKQRLGVIYLFSTMYVDGKDIPYAATTRGRSNAIDLSLQTKTQKVAGQILEYLQRAAEWIKAKIAAALDYFDSNIELIIAGVVGATAISLSSELTALAKKATPIFGSAVDALKGVDKAFTNAKALFDSWITGACAQVSEGHPAVIVDGIRRGMKASLFDGLFQAAKGATSVAGEFVTLGAGKIALTVIGAVEKLIKAIWRAIESSKMAKFFAEAENHWLNRGGADSIHLDQRRFVEWYKPYAMSVPLIAAVALLSGICGDKMAYLAMYQKDLTVVTADQFRLGSEALDSMKPWCAKYVKDSGMELVSNNAMLAKMLKLPEAKQTEMLSQVLAAAT